MYESSDSHLLRSTIGTQSGPDGFDKSRLVMNFLTNLFYMNMMQFQISLRRKSR